MYITKINIPQDLSNLYKYLQWSTNDTKYSSKSILIMIRTEIDIPQYNIKISKHNLKVL